MSHYTHHIDDSGKEPTIIEIGEAYPEELDPELHEFNRIKGRVAEAGLKLRQVQARNEEWGRVLLADIEDWQDYKAKHPPLLEAVKEAEVEYSHALDEYEKMVSAE